MTGQVVIFDIDGTLADCGHRMHFIEPQEGKKKNWGAFFKEAKNDKVIDHVALINGLVSGACSHSTDLFIYVITGRPESMRADTEAWLKANDIRFDKLFMRPHNEFKKDYEVKRDVLNNEIRAKGLNPWMVFEDKLDVCEMWREEGVPVFVCGDAWRSKKA